MANIKITCDSTCDLPQEIYQKYNVDVISLSVALGDALCRDGVDVTTAEVFAFVSKTGTLPKTSAVSMGEYLEVFSKYVEQGQTVIHINLCSDLSSSHQNARLAAAELENVYVIDSRNLSTGSGHLVVEAAEMAQQGLDAETIVARLNELKERVSASFVLQTLEYLQKGCCNSYTIENLFNDYMALANKRVGVSLCQRVYDKYVQIREMFCKKINPNKQVTEITNN